MRSDQLSGVPVRFYSRSFRSWFVAIELLVVFPATADVHIRFCPYAIVKTAKKFWHSLFFPSPEVGDLFQDFQSHRRTFSSRGQRNPEFVIFSSAAYLASTTLSVHARTYRWMSTHE